MTDARELVNQYFAAEEAGDIETVVALCHPEVLIRNAANSPQHGKEGARRFATDFKARTEQRRFEVLAVAQNGDVVFAWWRGAIRFHAGVRFGEIVTQRPFNLDIEGICRFKVTADNLIRELEVHHETTSARWLAEQAATNELS